MASDKKDFSIPNGKHVMMIDSVEYKTIGQKDTEIVNLKLKMADGSTYFHSFFAHTEGSIKMAAPQLKKLMLLEKLPIYKTVEDLIADKTNFLKKLEVALTGLLKKKIEVTAESYNSKKTNQMEQMVRITGYIDTPNDAVQTVPKTIGHVVSARDEIPF
jgi:hypothetical protein